MFEPLATAPVLGSTLRAPGVDVDDIELPGLAALPRLDDGTVCGGTLIEFLGRLPVESLASDYDVLEWTAAWERVATWAQARACTGLAEFVRRPFHIGPEESAVARRAPVGEMAREFANDEVAVRLGLSSRSMADRIDVALTLANKLPATRAAFGSGRLDYVKARTIADACSNIDSELSGEVERRVLERAAEQNPSRLRQRVRREVLATDPRGADERCKAAKDDRYVWITPGADGMAWLNALLPAANAVAIDAALNAAARHMKDALGVVNANADGGAEQGRAGGNDAHAKPIPTMAQLRADALAQPFLKALSTGVLDGSEPTNLARHRGRPPQIHVTVPMDVLIGTSDAPGELAGYGPITAEVAREIARDGVWRRLVTDPLSGAVLDVGRETYVPPAELQRYVEARDVTCRFPGCGRRAEGCDLDHTVPHPRGSTSHGNLGALCRRHHRFKHAGGGEPRLQQPQPGHFVWNMPTGHSYTVQPAAVGPPAVGPPAVGPPAVDTASDRRSRRAMPELLGCTDSVSVFEERLAHALAA
jgi:hypothetical protein